MALRAAPESIDELRARKHDARSETAELRMEIRAAGQEMVAMANRIRNALVADDIRSADHYTTRLAFLGQRYANHDEGGSVA